MTGSPKFVRPWDQVYEINRLMETYSESVRTAYDGFYREALERDLILEDEPRFHFIERVWPQDIQAEPYFTFSYFNRKSFSEDSDLNPLFGAFFEGEKLSAALNSVISAVEAHKDDTAIKDAREFFIRVGAKHDSGEMFDRGELHHHMVAVFSRIPQTGAIPAALTNKLYEFDADGPHDAVFVCTHDALNAATELPDFTALWWSIDGSRPVTMDLVQDVGAANLLSNPALKAIDAYLRSPAAKVREPSDRRRVLMMYQPIFELHARRSHHGGLIGWMFQFLSLGVSDTPFAMATIRKVLQCSEAGRAYVQACNANLDFVALGVGAYSVNEALSQEVRPGVDPYYLLRNFAHFLGGWQICKEDPGQESSIILPLVRSGKDATICHLAPRSRHIPHGSLTIGHEGDTRLRDRLRSRYQYAYDKAELLLHWAKQRRTDDEMSALLRSLGYYLSRVWLALQQLGPGGDTLAHNMGAAPLQLHGALKAVHETRSFPVDIDDHVIVRTVDELVNALARQDMQPATQALVSLRTNNWYDYRPANSGLEAACICECDYNKMRAIICNQNRFHNHNETVTEKKRLHTLVFELRVCNSPKSLHQDSEDATASLAAGFRGEVDHQKLSALYHLVCRLYGGSIIIRMNANGASATIRAVCDPTVPPWADLPAGQPDVPNWSGAICYELEFKSREQWEALDPKARERQ